MRSLKLKEWVLTSFSSYGNFITNAPGRKINIVADAPIFADHA